ncbi:MAG: HAMP domain-containing protein [Deltaproteobacteria bacterium]|nr:HAMP domain-containing protein [Deltaproteobacteria bacterium]
MPLALNNLKAAGRGGLAFRMSFFILTSTACIFIAVFGYNYFYSRSQILADVEKNSEIITVATVSKIEIVLNGVEKVPSYLARSLESSKPSLTELQKRIIDLLQTNSEIFGSAVAYEPYAFDGKSRYSAPYICRGQYGVLVPSFLGNDEYQYFFLDWYQMPKELGKPVWSEPYFDEGAGNIMMSTYSVPFYNYKNGKLIFTGIVTADISLEWLMETIKKISSHQSSYSFLISRNGIFVSHPNKDYIMRESIFSIAEANHDNDLREIGRNMIRGGKGFVTLKNHFAGQKSWMYYAPLPSLGWSIGVVFPEDRLFAGIGKLGAIIMAIGGAGFFALLVVIIAISGTVTKPLRVLADKAGEIARGNLEVEIPTVRSHDEVAALSNSFHNMKVALKEYISNLAETTAAKERIESELKIAHTIQMSFLPKRFPPFPEKEEFEIFAILEPAKEVGGDLYDFFLIDEEHVFFSIGDVSGKGVPAALFMAVTKTLMKGIASQAVFPSMALSNVNQELCKDNDSSMFVTVFCGILNFKTGELLFANAGHNLPVLISAGGEIRWLESPPGFLLGIMEDTQYETSRMILTPGDTLFLYTDGVTEAMNSQQAFFSDPTLIETIARCPDQRTPEAIIDCVLKAVKAFTGEEPQSDDITMLALYYRGKGSRKK